MTEEAPSKTRSALVSTTLSLVSLQLFSRLFSFSLNQLLIRFTTPQALGLATITLDVIRDTGLFLLRDGMRGAIARKRVSSINLSSTLLLPALLSPLLSFPFLLYSFYPPLTLPPHFNSTLLLYALSSVTELLAEPFYLRSLLNWESQTSLRVKVEGTAVAAKSLATLATVWGGGEEYALLSYGVGQWVYSLCLLAGFWWVIPRYEKKTDEKEDQGLDKDLIKTTWSLTKQSFVKQLLTESDKILVGKFSTVEDQGGYAVALNYGSLIARILFQPLEESSRLYFSRTLSVTPIRPSSLSASSSLLSLLLLLHTHLSLIFVALCPAYTSSLLYHLLGPRWGLSSAAKILRSYCFYLPFLALNGITEAFFQSVADDKWLKKGSWGMGIASIGFLVSTWFWGTMTGNCVNMLIRILVSATFIYSWFGIPSHLPGRGNLYWRNWVPKWQTLVVFAIAGVVVRWSEENFDWKLRAGFGKHLLVGGGCGIVCLGVVFKAERKNWSRIKDMLSNNKKVD